MLLDLRLVAEVVECSAPMRSSARHDPAVTATIDLGQDGAQGLEARRQVEQRHAAERGALARLHRQVFDARLGQEAIERGLILHVQDLLALFDAEQRRLRDVQVAVVDQLAHLPVEEGQKQRANVAAVDVGVRHQNDAVVAQLRQVEAAVVADAAAQRARSAWRPLAKRACDPSRARSTFRILPLSGKIAWKCRSRPCLALPPALSPSTM